MADILYRFPVYPEYPYQHHQKEQTKTPTVARTTHVSLSLNISRRDIRLPQMRIEHYYVATSIWRKKHTCSLALRQYQFTTVPANHFCNISNNNPASQAEKHLFCHSERSEESLFDLSVRAKTKRDSSLCSE